MDTTLTALTDEQLDAIRQDHNDHLGRGWTQEYIEGSVDEPAYYRVATAEGTVVATIPDWAGSIALFLVEAQDYVPQLVAEVERLRDEVKELRHDTRKLRALRAMGVDNWDGYSAAMSMLED